MKPTLRPASLARHAILLAFLLLLAYPLIWMLFTALRTEAAVLQHPFGLPLPPTGRNLLYVLRAGGLPRAYRNSLLVTLLGVLGAVVCGAPTAFAFARMRFQGRHLLFLLFLLGLMIPVHVTLIPLNRLLGAQGLHLKGTLWALIGPYIGFALPITILILKGAFEGLPDELFDAGRIDGCGPWRNFIHVALPLARPALATVIIFNFLTMRNEFAFALTLLDPDQATLPLAITQFRGEHDIELTRTCAALAVAILPLLILYCLAQKQIVRGLTAGAVKE